MDWVPSHGLLHRAVRGFLGLAPSNGFFPGALCIAVQQCASRGRIGRANPPLPCRSCLQLDLANLVCVLDALQLQVILIADLSQKESVEHGGREHRLCRLLCLLGMQPGGG